MIESIASYLVKWMKDCQVITANDQNVYSYGCEILVSTVVNIMILCFTGTVFHRIPQTIIFIICFAFVKRYAGGYHAQTYWRCIITFSALYMLLLLVFMKFDFKKLNLILLILWGISTFIIYAFVPVVDKNKKMTLSEIRKSRKKCLRNYFSISVVLFIIYLLGIMD